jgi:translation initiation factor 2B subunit (eIF-2B alpha/beta/delta family)
MDDDAHLDAVVAPLRADTVSGAAVVARIAAEVMRRAAVRLPAASLEELRWGLGRVAVRVLDAQPSMAPLVRLLQDVLSAVADAGTLQDARHAAVDAAEEFSVGLDARAEAVAEQAAAILPMDEMVATISSSSTVRTVLLGSRASGVGGSLEGRGSGALPRPSDDAAAARPGTPPRRVLCLESRPMQEGRVLAEFLAREGVDVTFAVDAAAFALLPRCGAVLLGADSIGDAGVVNKIGSAALAHAADAAGVPVYVLCDETKILPPGFPQIVDDDRPASEVWKAPAGVRVWNRYFETLPLEKVTGVVTEDGVLTPEQLEARRARQDFPGFLRRWAEAR